MAAGAAGVRVDGAHGGLIAAVGVWLLGLPLGAAVLLGAILAPTDPVLASDVQVEHPADRDRLRFGLTGEAGLNDGTAFPFVMLGLGLIGLHDLGPLGWRWLAVDVVWAVAAGLAMGAAAGHARRHASCCTCDSSTRRRSGWTTSFRSACSRWRTAPPWPRTRTASSPCSPRASRCGGWRREHNEGDVPADVARRRREGAGEPATAGTDRNATDPETAPAYMAQAVLGFNEQLERIGEVAIVVLLGGMLSARYLPREAVWFVPLLLLVIRPVAVYLGLVGMRATQLQRGLIGWFGIRGVGSLYYLAYAITHGVGGNDAQRFAGLTLTTIAASVTLHGLSVTPLMNLYERMSGRRSPPAPRRRASRAGLPAAASGARTRRPFVRAFGAPVRGTCWSTSASAIGLVTRAASLRPWT